MLDMARNQARNSSTFNAILKQFDYNAVGTEGGKAILTIPDTELAQELVRRFAAWTRNADFYDGLPFNQLLKLILKTQLLGGDCVLMIDDDIVEDSGRIMLFEPDELGEVPVDALASRYGKKPGSRWARYTTRTDGSSEHAYRVRSAVSRRSTRRARTCSSATPTADSSTIYG